MSTPPYYQNTPPPAKSNSGGCWKAAGIGCGVIILLGVIGTFVAVQKAKQFMNDPKNKNMMGSIMNVGATAQDGVKIRQAIVSYHTKTGHYPTKLAALVPGYLPAARLHAKTDANPSPQHVSWTYMPPPEGADPKTPIIKTSVNMQFGGQNTESVIAINLDGTSSTMAAGQRPSM